MPRDSRSGLPGLWLGHVPNPFGLAAPSRHFERALIRYDKMLRLFPSQTEAIYRLVRVCRREARLGLHLAGELHQHPDTRICVNEGVLPIAALHGWALQSPERVIRDLQARDTWLHGGADPNTAIDKLEALMDRQAAEAQAARDAEADGDLDERSATAFRWIKYGPPAWSRGAAVPKVPTPTTPLPPIRPATVPPTAPTAGFMAEHGLAPGLAPEAPT